jgi:hypothetical protein
MKRGHIFRMRGGVPLKAPVVEFYAVRKELSHHYFRKWPVIQNRLTR